MVIFTISVVEDTPAATVGDPIDDELDDGKLLTDFVLIYCIHGCDINKDFLA